MVDIWQVTPGDIIHRVHVGLMDQDVPLMVLACRAEEQGGFGPFLHVYGIYMVASGNVLLQNIVIDSLGAHDYEWVVRCKTRTVGCTVGS